MSEKQANTFRIKDVHQIIADCVLRLRRDKVEERIVMIVRRTARRRRDGHRGRHIRRQRTMRAAWSR